MSLGAVDQEDLTRWRARASGCRRQCCPNLEDPHTIRIGATVEREIPGDSQCGRGLINARGEGLPSYICGNGGSSSGSRCIVIRRCQVNLGPPSNRIGRV